MMDGDRGCELDDDEAILAGIPTSVVEPQQPPGLAQNKDDKLTQSQMLKRLLEADERDN